MQKLFKLALSFMAFNWFGFTAFAVEVSSMRAYDITGYGDFLFQVEPLKFGEFSESGTAAAWYVRYENEVYYCEFVTGPWAVDGEPMVQRACYDGYPD